MLLPGDFTILSLDDAGKLLKFIEGEPPTRANLEAIHQAGLREIHQKLKEATKLKRVREDLDQKIDELKTYIDNMP